MLILIAIGSIVGMFVLAAVILMIRDRIVAPRRRSPEEIRADAEEARDRLLNPDWETVEQQLARPVPVVLRDMYADHALLLSAPLTVIEPGVDTEWDITSFEPATGRREYVWIPRQAFCFATSWVGDPYYVEIGPNGEDGPVSIHYHDGGDVERIADTMAEFLSWPRRPDRSFHDGES